MNKTIQFLLNATVALMVAPSFGGLLDKVGDQADKVESMYEYIWNGFYGDGNYKHFFKARLDMRPDGTPNIVLDKSKGTAEFKIRLSVNDVVYNGWKADAHQRIADVGMSFRFSEFEDPEAHVIGGKAYRFGDNEEAAFRRWDNSGKKTKAEIIVRVETVKADGGWLRRWDVPLSKFERLGYASYPLPLKDLNRLKDLPASVFGWIKEGVDVGSGVEDAYVTVSVSGMTSDEMAAIEDVRCTVLDGVDLKEAARIEKAARCAISELPSQMVDIPGKNYKMCKYEVTQALWVAIMGDNPSEFKGSDRPVECISWNDCQKFLEKLNANLDVKKTGLVFRLPTEEEWEHACRAGSTRNYCAMADGSEITKGTLGTVAWYDDNSTYETHPVGQKKPNAWGLYDMHGNVWEWTSTAVDDLRVCRGGGWFDFADFCTCGNRDGDNPDNRNDDFGLRLVASAGQ